MTFGYSFNDPPSNQETVYVGIWMDDTISGEYYERARLEPFARCVAASVGLDEEWKKHPRPIFEGTSGDRAAWSRKYNRSTAEGIFVEVPKSVARRLLSAINTTLSVRGTLEAAILDSSQLNRHSLTTNRWMVGDVLVYCDGSTGKHPPGGIRSAYLTEDEYLRFGYYAREDAETTIWAALDREIFEPSSATSEPVQSRPETETIVADLDYDIVRGSHVMAADLAVFVANEKQADLQDSIVRHIAARLAKKNYRVEVIVWWWNGIVPRHGESLFIALTSSNNRIKISTLLAGFRLVPFEYGGDALGQNAQPLLHWSPGTGLIRFWLNSPPPPESIAVGDRTVKISHRVVDVVARRRNSVADFHMVSVSLKNFRCFSVFEFRPDRHFHVVIGDNSSGKTALLEALAIFLGHVFRPENRNLLLRRSDARKVLASSDAHGNNETFDASISGTIYARFSGVSRGTVSQIDGVSLESRPLMEFSLALREIIEREHEAELPLCVYYSNSRTFRPSSPPEYSGEVSESRLDGYQGALDGKLDPAPVQKWFRYMESVAKNEERPNFLLEAVRSAISICVEGCRSVRYAENMGEVVLEFYDGRLVPFQRLSDGYRLILAMAADIAWRCAALNPHLRSAATTETSGVVLIDEIDLHLHPKWQRGIVFNLMRAFPRLQFIVTTHSPFVIQSMKSGQVSSLDRDAGAPDYQASSIEDIAEEVMGVDGVQRSRRFHAMERAAAEYYEIIGRHSSSPKELAEAKARLNELLAPFADNAAYAALLRMRGVAEGYE